MKFSTIFAVMCITFFTGLVLVGAIASELCKAPGTNVANNDCMSAALMFGMFPVLWLCFVVVETLFDNE